MRIRKMIALLLVGITCMLLMGCNRENEYINLESLETGFTGSVYVDKNTGVMYFSHGYGFSPIYNADGTLKIYDELDNE